MAEYLNSLIAQGFKPTVSLMGAKSNALNALAQEQNYLNATRQAQEYPEELEWRREQRAASREKLGWEREKMGREKEMQPLKDEVEAMGYLAEIAPLIRWDNYDESRQHLVDINKINPSVLPEKEYFYNQALSALDQAGQLTTEMLQNPELLNPYVEQIFEQWKNNSTMTLTKRQAQIKAEAERAKAMKENIKDFETWVMPDGSTINLRKGQEPPAGAVPFKGKGMDIEFDPESGRPIRISQGGGPGDKSQLSKGTQTKVEEKIIAGTEQIARIQEIKNKFKAEYQTIGKRLSVAKNAMKSKLGGQLSDEEKAEMKEVSQYLRTTIENLNLYIKELTGAQMSEQEAGRLSLAQPKPGQSWFDFLVNGDSAEQIEAKIEDIDRAARASVARYDYYRNKGLGHEEIKKLVQSNAAMPLSDIISRMQ